MRTRRSGCGEGLKSDVSAGYHRERRPGLKEGSEQCSTSAHTNKDIGKKNYCAQNRMRNQLSRFFWSNQINGSGRNTCFAKYGETFVTSSSLRRVAEIKEAYQVSDYKVDVDATGFRLF